MKPRVLLIIDTAGWCFNNIANQIVKAFSDRYDFEIVIKVPEAGLTADVALVFWWKTALLNIQKERLHVKRLAVGMYDHWSIPAMPHEVARLIPHVDCFYVANDKLATDIRLRAPDTPIYVTEDGVDCNLFPVQPLPAEFTVGWTGNRVYKSMGLGDYKGCKLIEEACHVTDLPIVIQDKQKTQFSLDQMASKFYQKISCYVCASVAEGGPNPVLEALACGRSVVSTDVGIVSKVAKRSSGAVIVVDRTLKGIAEGIFQAKQMGDCSQQARESVAPWDWKENVKSFAPVLGGI